MTKIRRQAYFGIRLGAARECRGDSKQGRTAFEKAISIDPHSVDVLSARRGMVSLLLQQPQPLVEADEKRLREQLQALALEGDASETAAFADYLETSPNTRDLRWSRDIWICAAARGYYRETVPKTAPGIVLPIEPDAAYKGNMTAYRSTLFQGADDSPISEMFRTIAESAAMLWPDLESALQRHGLTAYRLPASTRAAALTMLPHVSAALGLGPVLAYGTDDPNIVIQVVCAGTPIVVLGPLLLQNKVSPLEARFWIARALENTRPAHIVARGLPRQDAATLYASLLRMFSPPEKRQVADNDSDRTFDDMLKSSLPLKIRTRLEGIIAQIEGEPPSLDAFLNQVNLSADRIATVLSPDIPVAFRMVLPISGDPKHIPELGLDPAWPQIRIDLLG